MIEITVEDLTGLAPEFITLSDTSEGEAQINLMIEYARLWVNENKWGSKAKMGTILVACHLLKELGHGNGGANTDVAGPVTMKKVGDLQVSYGSASIQGGSASDQLFATTKYGQQYILLRKTLYFTPMVT